MCNFGHRKCAISIIVATLSAVASLGAVPQARCGERSGVRVSEHRHCFRRVSNASDTALVGLHFSPLPNATVADIEGTLWLALRLASVADGRLIVAAWSIIAPVVRSEPTLVRSGAPVAPRFSGTRSTRIAPSYWAAPTFWRTPL